MKFNRILVLAVVLVIPAINHSIAGDIPNEVYVRLTGGTISSSDWSGTLNQENETITWVVTDYSAEFVFTGDISTFPGPASAFYLRWADTGSILPLSVTITSTTSVPYDFSPSVQHEANGAWDRSLLQEAVVGDWYFGHYFYNLAGLRFTLGPSSIEWYTGPVDLTVTMEWGPGVPNQHASWGAVKSLYR
jgi:hypothetical protein